MRRGENTKRRGLGGGGQVGHWRQVGAAGTQLEHQDETLTGVFRIGLIKGLKTRCKVI